MVPLLRVLAFFSVFLLALSSNLAGAQTYTSVVIFGDSLSDTGNVTHLTQSQFLVPIPGPLPSNYTLGRFTDGADTLPAAKLYTGVWIEQLASGLANKPAIKNSLDGGTNYAYGYASTGTGTSALNLAAGISVTVNNMGQQVADYLATKPTINNKTLYVVWGGANDLLMATTPAAITAAATQEVSVVQTLVAAGATDFIVPNLPPLGLIPRLNMNTAAATQANSAAAAFNIALAAGLAGFPAANPGKNLHVYPLDVFTLFNTVVANAATNGLANVTASAQGNRTVNPDTFLFWDDLHPTTTGHHLISAAASTLVAPGFTTSTALTTSAASTVFGTPVTFTAAVASAAGQPTGTVTFLDGSTSLGTGTLAATSLGNVASATLSVSSLAIGPHTITASYAASGGFGASTSSAITQTVTAASFNSAASPTSVTIARGSTGTSTISITPVGTYVGAVNLACGALPARVSCAFAPASLSFTAASTAAQTSTLTIGTTGIAELLTPRRPGAFAAPGIVSAFTLLPFLGGVTIFTLRRRGYGNLRLLTVLAFLSTGTILGLAGCGGSDNKAAPGTYTIPVNVTANSTTSTVNLTVTVQ